MVCYPKRLLLGRVARRMNGEWGGESEGSSSPLLSSLLVLCVRIIEKKAGGAKKKHVINLSGADFLCDRYDDQQIDGFLH